MAAPDPLGMHATMSPPGDMPTAGGDGGPTGGARGSGGVWAIWAMGATGVGAGPGWSCSCRGRRGPLRDPRIELGPNMMEDFFGFAKNFFLHPFYCFQLSVAAYTSRKSVRIQKNTLSQRWQQGLCPSPYTSKINYIQISSQDTTSIHR